jgi:hypothetical protein
MTTSPSECKKGLNPVFKPVVLALKGGNKKMLQINVRINPQDKHGALVTVGDRQHSLNKREMVDTALAMVEAAEELFYLAEKQHSADACAAMIRYLLPNLLRKEE